MKTDWVSKVTQLISDAHHTALCPRQHTTRRSAIPQVNDTDGWGETCADQRHTPPNLKLLDNLLQSREWRLIQVHGCQRPTNFSCVLHSTRIAHATQGRLCGLIARRWNHWIWSRSRIVMRGISPLSHPFVRRFNASETAIYLKKLLVHG